MNRILLITAVFGSIATAAPSLATHPVGEPQIITFMSGLQEVGNDGTVGVGDPDASGTAELWQDHEDLVYSIEYFNVSGDSVSGLHIHGPGATPSNNRPIFIDLVQDLTVPPPLPSGTISGRVSAFRDPALGPKIEQVFASPTEFYVNLHTSGAGGYPAGAIRGHLPEPGAAGALVAAAAGMLLRRRRGASTGPGAAPRTRSE